MISEFIIFRLAENDINFMKIDSTLKLKFYTKLKSEGLSKDKFFRMCFEAFLDDDDDILKLVANEKYLQHVENENRMKRKIEDHLKQKMSIENSNRFTALRKLKEYDIEYFFDEE